jgi:hypothetical protein
MRLALALYPPTARKEAAASKALRKSPCGSPTKPQKVIIRKKAKALSALPKQSYANY